jgi:pyruvate,orthophosphate dikinase
MVKVARAEERGQVDEADVRLLAAVNRLHESNPMLGLRGVRLGLTLPGLFAVQIRALARRPPSACGPVAILAPRSWCRWSGSVMELHLVRDEATALLAEVSAAEGVALDIPIGTMVELPACGADRAPHRRGRGLRVVRHQRPDADHLGLQPRRRRGQLLRRLPRQGRLHRVAVREP